jgi:hypothetical protein
MNDDSKFGNMAEGEFRNLQEAPLQNTPDAAARNAQIDDLPAGFSADALGNQIDEDIEIADLDEEVLLTDEALADVDGDIPANAGFREILETDLGEALSDGGESFAHIHSPDMDAPDTPGEIDIEDLQEGDLEGTGIPADALLDPIEE